MLPSIHAQTDRLRDACAAIVASSRPIALVEAVVYILHTRRPANAVQGLLLESATLHPPEAQQLAGSLPTGALLANGSLLDAVFHIPLPSQDSGEVGHQDALVIHPEAPDAGPTASEPRKDIVRRDSRKSPAVTITRR
ncbi:hypothetical protein PSPO01_07165 [Paraphaeosphaeria sporulosa]